MQSMTTHTELELSDIQKIFGKKLDLAGKIVRRFGGNRLRTDVTAVDGVNMTVATGEVMGLVGESGCGKSTLGRIVAGIIDPTRGTVRYRGQDIRQLPKSLKKKAFLAIQMIFQDPYASLNSRMKVHKIIGEAAIVHGMVTQADSSEYIDQLMEKCGLDPVYKNRYPHQFSGGQRQRIAIARSLAVNPQFLVCDEIVSALDVSIQAQILNMFMDLRNQLGFSAIFISHDLGVVEHVSDRVSVMYLGKIVEQAQTEDLFDNPFHPYTQSLLDEVPALDKRNFEFGHLKGEIPSPLNPPTGCYFHPRCPVSQTLCSEIEPQLTDRRGGRRCACHYA